jgi:hypothetical protein
LQELPNVVALHDKFKDSGVRVIGVSLDFHRQVLVDYLAQSPTPWSHIIFDGETQLGWDNPLARKLGVTGIPFLVVIGKDGLVYAADVRGPALERAVVGAIAGQNPLAPPAQVRLHRQLYDLFSLAPVWATAIVVFTGAMIGLAIELLLRGRAATPLAMDGPG